MADHLPSICLNDGVLMPVVGLGTFVGILNSMPNPEVICDSIKHAIELGYRHFDTAEMYNTEEILGAAINAKIKDGTVKRKDLFITSKLGNMDMRPDLVVAALRNSLGKLKLDHVDNFIIHWPVALTTDSSWTKGIKIDDGVSFLDTWKAMEECKKLGLTSSIGVSNFNRRQLQLILADCDIRPSNNQVEVNVFFQNRKLIEFCKQKDVAIVAYGPLAGARYDFETQSMIKRDVGGNSELSCLANKYKKTNYQIALKFLLQLGLSIIPKSLDPKRQLDNINLFDFEIDQADMKKMYELDTNKRFYDYGEVFGEGKEFPFTEEY